MNDKTLHEKLTDLVREHGVYAVEDAVKAITQPRAEDVLAYAAVCVKAYRGVDGEFTQRIPAIKMLRDKFPGLGLKGCKDIIDAVAPLMSALG